MRHRHRQRVVQAQVVRLLGDRLSEQPRCRDPVAAIERPEGLGDAVGLLLGRGRTAAGGEGQADQERGESATHAQMLRNRTRPSTTACWSPGEPAWAVRSVWVLIWMRTSRMLSRLLSRVPAAL